MSKQQTAQGASAPLSPEEQLTAALLAGKVGIGGAMCQFPELSISQIVAIASAVSKQK